MNLQVAAHIRNPRFNKDGSATLAFTTSREITDDEAVLLLNEGRRDELGWLLWSPNKIQIEDLPLEQASDNHKTPSKRLRATLFILWKQQGEKGTFENFYIEKMEKLIDHVKSKLD